VETSDLDKSFRSVKSAAKPLHFWLKYVLRLNLAQQKSKSKSEVTHCLLNGSKLTRNQMLKS